MLLLQFETLSIKLEQYHKQTIDGDRNLHRPFIMKAFFNQMNVNKTS